MQPSEARRVNPRLIYVAIFLLLLLVYLPAITIKYAFLDSYILLASGIQGQLHGILQMIVQGGRPLYAIYTSVAYGHTASIGDLRYLRAFGVAGIGVLACLLYRALSETTVHAAAAIAGSVLFCLTPSFQIYAAWDACATAPWAAVLAAFAFLLCDQGGARRMAGAAFLLFCAMMIYQPATMVFWDFAAVAWLLRPALPAMRRILAAAGVMAAALAGDYAALKLLPRWLYGDGAVFSRTALVHDIYGKVVWFFHEPLFDALNLFSIQPSVNIVSGIFSLRPGWGVYQPFANIADAVLLGTLTFVGAWLYFGRGAPARIMLALCLVPATYIPNLLVAENWASYRTQDALAGLFVLFGIVAVLGWVRVLRLGRLVPGLCVAAVGIAAWCAASNVMNEFAVPQAREYRIVQTALLHMTFPAGARPCFNLPVWTETLAPVARYDEFGVLSTSVPWVPASMAWLILRQRHSPDAALFTIQANVPTSVAAGCTVVDLRAILAAGKNWSE